MLRALGGRESDALATIVTDAGARPWNRDAADLRFIAELTSYGTLGSIKETVPAWPTIAGGAAPTDTDLDGMPDTWETWYGTDPATPSNNLVGQDGYTALELYLQWLIDPGSVVPLV